MVARDDDEVPMRSKSFFLLIFVVGKITKLVIRFDRISIRIHQSSSILSMIIETLRVRMRLTKTVEPMSMLCAVC